MTDVQQELFPAKDALFMRRSKSIQVLELFRFLPLFLRRICHAAFIQCPLYHMFELPTVVSLSPLIPGTLAQDKSQKRPSSHMSDDEGPQAAVETTDDSARNLFLLCCAYMVGFSTMTATLTTTAISTKDVLASNGDSTEWATVPIGVQV